MAANSRLARFITEVAPPQFVSVMRHRTSKVLDTIKEEDRDFGGNDHSTNNTRTSKSASSPSASASASGANSNYFLKGVHRSFSIFE